MEPAFFTVNDRGRQLDFEGFHLASASSFAVGKSRWFEVSIYKTVGGNYILSGSGPSLVVHRPNCSQMRDRTSELQDPLADSQPCDKCKPDLTKKVVRETDREWAQISNDPHTVIEKLRLKDKKNEWYMPKTSYTALVQAAELDSGIKEAFFAPQHIK